MMAALKVDACHDSHNCLFEHGAETLPMDLVGKNNGFDEVKPVAVIGFSLKFPQDATSAESFTSLLREGRCAVSEFPKDRINIDAFYSTDANRNDTVCCTSERNREYADHQVVCFPWRSLSMR